RRLKPALYNPLHVERRLQPPRTARVLDAKRCMGGTWIEWGAALVCARDRPGGNRWRDDDRRRRRGGYGNRIQPGIDDRERNITRLVTQHATRRGDGNTRRRAVMLVTRRLRRGRCALMMAGDRARELARGDDHGWPHEDQHHQPRDEARQHRIHRSTYSAARRRRSAFAMTDTELNVIAALAIMGLRSRPKTGYSKPAATGTPSML